MNERHFYDYFAKGNIGSLDFYRLLWIKDPLLSREMRASLIIVHFLGFHLNPEFSELLYFVQVWVVEAKI